jgi:hypothetical protein
MDLTYVYIGIPILLGAAVLFFVLRARKPAEEEAVYTRCPGCKRRLRYMPRQVGHKAMCSHCKEQFVFPAPVRTAR